MPEKQFQQKQPPQHQDRQPGLESEKRPRPTAEKREYRGSGKLRDKVALITGGVLTILTIAPGIP